MSRTNQKVACCYVTCEIETRVWKLFIASKSTYNGRTADKNVIFKVILKSYWEETVKEKKWLNSSRKQKSLERYSNKR